uniref:Glutamate tRNA ligase n=1 Tax=Inonotus obliquus TaxID=167356 RepID=A0A5C2I8F1_9AGAM|nr:glutamate tRNA ligase [Inonotus obliquus]
MGITHVLRGEEWLPSLPLHLDLYACLGLTPPKYAHLPLLLNPDGSKMSKRKGDVSVSDYMDKGWMSSAVLNWLALAGWGTTHGEKEPGKGRTAAPSSTEVFALPELVEKFDLSVLTPRRSILDPQKLLVLSAKHLHRDIEDESKIDSLISSARALVMEHYKGPEHERIISGLDFREILNLTKDRLKRLNELPSILDFLFTYTEDRKGSDESDGDIKRYGEVTKKYINAIEATQSVQAPWNELTIQEVENLRESRDELVLLRRALTGQKVTVDVLFL